MHRYLASVALATAIFAGVALAPSANATTVTATISGSLNGHSFTGDINLDVVGGQAISGTGEISILGLTNAPMVLITSSTPDVHTPIVSYRANDGTDWIGANTVWPTDSVGLIFDVGTNSPLWGAFPMFNLASGTNNSVFTGIVNGVDYYQQIGTAGITVTPLPSTWTMLIAGFVGFGFLVYRGTKRGSAALAAA